MSTSSFHPINRRREGRCLDGSFGLDRLALQNSLLVARIASVSEVRSIIRARRRLRPKLWPRVTNCRTVTWRHCSQGLVHAKFAITIIVVLAMRDCGGFVTSPCGPCPSRHHGYEHTALFVDLGSRIPVLTCFKWPMNLRRPTVDLDFACFNSMAGRNRPRISVKSALTLLRHANFCRRRCRLHRPLSYHRHRNKAAYYGKSIASIRLFA